MSQRRLAAIMFTDIVGYTSLMGKDEDQAFSLLRKNLRLQRSIIRKYNGHFLKEIGDGILASFPLASDAVRCAKAIQTSVSAEGYELTIGIHTGEMVFEKADAWGDSVNVASRIQEQGETGSILISGTVYKDIKNQKEFKVNFLDERKLKNVDEPVKIYKVDYLNRTKISKISGQVNLLRNPLLYILSSLVLVTLISVFVFFFYSDKSTKDPTIAVLYVKNLSNNANDETRCEALTEVIINTLASIKDLNVLPSESVKKYKTSIATSKEIAIELNADYLLTVSFNKAQNRIQLIPVLYSAKENRIVQTPDDRDDWISEPQDQFTWLKEVAQKVAKELDIFLTSEEENLIDKKNFTDLSSYNYTSQNFVDQASGTIQSPKKIKLLLNWIHDPTFTGEYIAFEKFWNTKDYEIEILAGGVGINPISLVENKSVDYAIVGADKALIAISNNIPVKIIFVDQQRNPVGWIVRSQLGIDSFKDLLDNKDVVLGDKSGTEISSILQLILNNTGYNLKPQAVNYDFDYFLTNRKVVYPVYLNEEPIKATLIHNLEITTIDPSKKINGGIKLYGNVIITHNDKFKQSFEEVDFFITGIKNGWKFASENHAEALKIVNKYVRHNEDYVEGVMLKSIEFATSKYGKAVPPGDMDIKTWESTILVLNKAGILSKPVDIEANVYFK